MNNILITKIKSSIPLHIIILPGIIATLLFSYVPMYGIIIAFKNFSPTKGILGSRWIGLKYFERLFKMSDFYNILRNTIFISITKIFTLLLIALIIALLLNEVKNKKINRLFQSCLIFPHFLSWIILGGLIRSILADNGMVNQILTQFGMKSVLFLGNPQWFIAVLLLSNLWQEAGFSAILFTAAIAGVDETLYEAATIDGANRWQQTWHITLKCIQPFIILLVILNVGNILNAGFDQIFNLYNGTVLNVADILDTYVYRVGLQGAQYSFGTAVGLFKSIIGLILISISYFLADKIADYKIF